MNEYFEYIASISKEVSRADYLIIGLLILLTTLIIILETLSKKAKSKQQAAGITPEIKSVVTHDVKASANKEYISSAQKLAGRPDAVIKENGYMIPVERKPFSNKIRDRYIAQLLVYMRLIEEFEGKKPPYGYLILGKNSRRVKILNSEARQNWLQKILDEMQAILNEERPVVAAPLKRKCERCSVAKYCDSKILF